MPHLPYATEEDEYYHEAERRFDAIDDEVDEFAEEYDDDTSRSRSRVATLFAAWIGATLVSKQLEPASHAIPENESQYSWFDHHISRTYTEGANAASTLLESAGYNVPNTPGVRNSPIHRQARKRVFEFQRRAWQDLADDLPGEIRGAVREALADGTISDAKAAVRDRIQHVGRYRANLIARHETARAYNYALVSEYEEAGVQNVEVHDVDWTTAGDERVCDSCAARAGTYSIAEMKRLLRSGEFPHHVLCRCLLLPSSK